MAVAAWLCLADRLKGYVGAMMADLRPTLPWFLVLWVALWLGTDMYLAIPAGMGWHGAIIGNLIFIAFNLIGTCFAFAGLTPWKD